MKLCNLIIGILPGLLATDCLARQAISESEGKFLLEESVPVSLEDYCFNITGKTTIGMAKKTTTPKKFLENNPDVQAAMNGTFFGPTYTPPNDQPEGIAYLAEGHHFATKKPEHISGYFTVSKDGKEVNLSETLKDPFSDYWLVIGTRPLLVVDGEMHQQAGHFGNLKAPRSAIGTKDGRNICFAVTDDSITMQQWANALTERDYLGAINLDGGPFAQLAVRGENPKGPGTGETRLVIFSYNKN